MGYFKIIMGLLGWIGMIVTMLVCSKSRRRLRRRRHSSYSSQPNVQDPKVVVIGGGTGQSVFLRGLKTVTKNITAVVTVSDDGGGSGALREDLGMLPPGDIRNCLLALANIEPTMSEVMQYRFPDGSLKGQSFGNLFLAAMNGIYGNFETAVYKLSEVFAITGKVLPATLQDVNLVARLKDGEVVRGESTIPKVARHRGTSIDMVRLDPPNVKPLGDVLNAIYDADVVVIGPGSLYTSVIPNLLIEGVADAIIETNAPKIYISNIMTQPGETGGYDVVDHIEAIEKHIGENYIDCVITNNEILPVEVLEHYQEKGAEQVFLDKKQADKLDKMGIKHIEKNMVDIKNNYIRHDAKYISNIIVEIASNLFY
ncbi:MAG: YvcK family protein [Clostridioides sp.]|jgi:uncharacterized cofD-like protein|nr:YvcK family protein [Clostridioides sp.]